MMPKTRIVLALVITALIAACQTDARFRTSGAGADLYAPEVATNTAEIEAYFGFLCVRAGLGSATASPACNVSTPNDWRMLVAAGYNDIDRRCDNYLEWLQAKRN